ncbi:T9SS type A sorting domain-containing protein [bacterium SCSIO 12741]|nr:T9SS type A sorting domain-containing protein [bacterium SCSIO 12741]
MRWLLIILCLYFPSVLLAQIEFKHQLGPISKAEQSRFAVRQADQTQVYTQRGKFDVREQSLFLRVDPAVHYIEGTVQTKVKVVAEGLDTIQLDLSNELQVDTVLVANQLMAITHENDVITIPLDSALPLDMELDIVILYKGEPTRSTRSFQTDTTGQGIPVLWTLSEPYGAKDWWPCKQDLTDKIEKLQISITAPSAYSSVSNGLKKLVEDKGNGWSKTVWEHNYPIVSYLVAITVAPYAYFEEDIPVGDKSLRFVNYVYPEDSAEAVNDLVDFDQTLHLFDSLFGTYPFIDEHYGHAQFKWGGGMEHQTMSFMYHFKHGLVAHELAHQWFGDQITCGSWQDLWLNEGFATYLEGLTYEFNIPVLWNAWKEDKISLITTHPGGSVHVPDTNNLGRLFDPKWTYAKGAYLLHMLRWKMGDEAFFEAIRNYLNDESLNYGFARTEDLIRHLKEAGGQGIDEFFNDWFYRQGWPSYTIEWYQDRQYNLYLILNQEQSWVWEGTFFDMVLPIHVVGDRTDTLLRLDHSYDRQEYKIPLEGPVRVVSFDPKRWILSADNEVIHVDYKHQPVSYKIAPNPVQDDVLTVIYSDAILPSLQIRIFDMSGRMVMEKQVTTQLSAESFSLSLAGIGKGQYLIEIKDFWEETTLKFQKQ